MPRGKIVVERFIAILTFVLTSSLTSRFACQTADAHSIDDEDSSTNLLDSLWEKDKKDALILSKSAPYIYEPSTQKNGELSGFKILDGAKELLSRSKPKTASFEQFWLVHPVTKLIAPPKSNDQDRLVSQVVGDKIRRASSAFVDINADGKPELIIGTYTGGAHCCFNYKIYSLGADAKLYDKIDGNDQQFMFADLNGDGKCEAIGYDFTFAYWNTDFADSPAPLVILKPTSNGFVLAADLMRTAAPDETQMIALVYACKKATESESVRRKDRTCDFSLAPELWKNMLALIYTGHSPDCWKLLDLVWPEGKKAMFGSGKADDRKPKPGNKEEFIAAFLAKLQESPYWDGIKKLNAGDKRFF